MRGGARLCIAKMLAVLLLCGAPAARADDLPPQGEALLHRILERPEYQPRGDKPSYLARLKHAALLKAQEVLRSVSGAIEDFLEAQAPAVEKLRPLFDALAAFFRVVMLLIYYVCLPLGLLYLFYRLLARYAGRLRPPPPEAQALAADPAPAAGRPPWELLAQGAVLEALIELHARLRCDVCRRHRFPRSATDREIAGALPDEAAVKGVFSESARLFEHAAFAQRPLEPAAVQALVSRSRVLLEEGR